MRPTETMHPGPAVRLPAHVQAEVQRILDREARRLLDEQSDRLPLVDEKEE